MLVAPSEGKEEVSGSRRESVFHMPRKEPFTVDLPMFVSGRTLNFYPISNFQVQVSPTFSKFIVRHLALLKDLRFHPASVAGRNLKRIFFL